MALETALGDCHQTFTLDLERERGFDSRQGCHFNRAAWCNGSTSGFGPDGWGSIPWAASNLIRRVGRVW